MSLSFILLNKNKTIFNCISYKKEAKLSELYDSFLMLDFILSSSIQEVAELFYHSEYAHKVSFKKVIT